MAAETSPIVLITGATSGIGKATAAKLSALGVRVAATGRDAKALDALKANGIAEWTFPADLTDKGAAQSVIDSLLKETGQLDGLVHAAGILTSGGMDNETDEGWSRQIEVNLNASWRMLKAAWESLKKTKGSAVLVSSVTGLRSFPGLVGYCVSKAGVDQLVRCAALDGAPHSVRVNGVNPGVVVTNLHRRGGMAEDNYSAFLEHSKDTHPLGRVGTSDEIAEAISWLLDGKTSGWITGVTLPIDGGRQLTCNR